MLLTRNLDADGVQYIDDQLAEPAVLVEREAAETDRMARQSAASMGRNVDKMIADAWKERLLYGGPVEDDE